MQRENLILQSSLTAVSLHGESQYWDQFSHKKNSRISGEIGNNQGQAWKGQPDTSGSSWHWIVKG